MASRKGRSRKNDDTIPCACGCGTLIYQWGTDGRPRRFVRGHQLKGNAYGQKTYDHQVILEQAESLRPPCNCGCGEKLDIPQFLQRKGKGLESIQSYWKRHPYRKGHGNWDLRTQKYITQASSISSENLGLIYGTLLGDGSITYPNQHSRFPRLAWTHGSAQLAWMEYKAERLAILQPKLRIAANQGYGAESVCCRTICHPDLVAVFQCVKPDGSSKTVSEQWLSQLSPEGRAWWYMDDGALALSPQGSPRICFHTEGYSEADNILIATWLNGLGYGAEVHSYTRRNSSRTYLYIALGANAARQWLADHNSYAIPAMDYKFGDGRICPPRWG
ncbi:hypothetical protein [Leptolyngbya sp. PCC 6406]|uniref:hypothetical protein n=1 Tax=Leptolyngbya sp. PCC 6406 TaxID=1173264 RepID=UPI0002F830A9